MSNVHCFWYKFLCQLSSQIFAADLESLIINLTLSHDGGSCHIATSSLISRKNQWTGFYMMRTSVVKQLRKYLGSILETLKEQPGSSCCAVFQRCFLRSSSEKLYKKFTRKQLLQRYYNCYKIQLLQSFKTLHTQTISPKKVLRCTFSPINFAKKIQNSFSIDHLRTVAINSLTNYGIF